MAKLNEWMSVSDLMTGLMIIFLFITVAYMKRVKDTHKVLEDYVETKQQPRFFHLKQEFSSFIFAYLGYYAIFPRKIYTFAHSSAEAPLISVSPLTFFDLLYF